MHASHMSSHFLHTVPLVVNLALLDFGLTTRMFIDAILTGWRFVAFLRVGAGDT